MRHLTKSFRQKFARAAGDRQLLSNEDGGAAIEFGMVALPFLMFVLGIIAIGLYFLSVTFLEYGVETAARKIRTGEVNTAGTNGAAMTVGQFRDLVCSAASPVIDCSKMSVKLQHAKSWSELTPESCIDNQGNMSGSSGQKDDALSDYSGGASEVVLVTLCYKWDLAESLSLLKMGSGPNGTGPAIIQAATAFKSEPYN